MPKVWRVPQAEVVNLAGMDAAMHLRVLAFGKPGLVVSSYVSAGDRFLLGLFAAVVHGANIAFACQVQADKIH